MKTPPKKSALLESHICRFNDGEQRCECFEAGMKAQKVTGETSDGFHTFNELYEFRKVYNCALFNEWSKQGKYSVHKSRKHSDGEDCFGGGWFIVSANLPQGQISNHYELKDWNLFRCEERERADTYDGHNSKDVIHRILSLK